MDRDDAEWLDNLTDLDLTEPEREKLAKMRCAVHRADEKANEWRLVHRGLLVKLNAYRGAMRAKYGKGKVCP